MPPLHRPTRVAWRARSTLPPGLWGAPRATAEPPGLECGSTSSALRWPLLCCRRAPAGSPSAARCSAWARRGDLTPGGRAAASPCPLPALSAPRSHRPPRPLRSPLLPPAGRLQRGVSCRRGRSALRREAAASRPPPPCSSSSSRLLCPPAPGPYLVRPVIRDIVNSAPAGSGLRRLVRRSPPRLWQPSPHPRARCVRCRRHAAACIPHPAAWREPPAWRGSVGSGLLMAAAALREVGACPPLPGGLRPRYRLWQRWVPPAASATPFASSRWRVE